MTTPTTPTTAQDRLDVIVDGRALSHAGATPPGSGSSTPRAPTPAAEMPSAETPRLTTLGVRADRADRRRGVGARLRHACSSFAARWDDSSAWARLDTLARAVRRRFAVWTPLAWAIAAVGVVGLVVGVWLHWAEFLVPGIAAFLLLPLCGVFTLRGSTYRGTVELSGHRVRVGDVATGSVHVTNAGNASRGAGRVELVIGRAAAPFDIPPLAGGAAHSENFGLPTTRRQVIPLGPLRAVQGDPLGVFRRQRSLTEPVLLYVHPQTVALAALVIGLLRDVEGVTTEKVSNSDVSFHALREYVPGDDRRFVHWRTSARLDKLVVRQFDQTLRAHLLVVLSSSPTDYGDTDEFELAVSTAASLVVQALREDRQVTLAYGTDLLSAVSGMRALDFLAGVELGTEPQALPHLVAVAAKAAPGASVMAVITGRHVTPSTFHQAAERGPRSAKTFAVQASAGAESSLRILAGLPVLRVGELAQLSHAVAGVR